jgi:hypothetical protein
MATKEKLEYKDFVGLTEWEKGWIWAFGAYELGAPKKFTQEQIFDRIKKEYQQRPQANYILREILTLCGMNIGRWHSNMATSWWWNATFCE